MKRGPNGKSVKRFSLALIVCIMLAAMAAWGLRTQAQAGLDPPILPEQDADGYYLIATSTDLAEFAKAVNYTDSNDIKLKLFHLLGTRASKMELLGSDV